jgi:hypothetical protein
LETLRILVEFSQVLHILENIIKSGFLRSSCEKDCRISAWDGVFLGRRLKDFKSCKNYLIIRG